MKKFLLILTLLNSLILQVLSQTYFQEYLLIPDTVEYDAIYVIDSLIYTIREKGSFDDNYIVEKNFVPIDTIKRLKLISAQSETQFLIFRSDKNDNNIKYIRYNLFTQKENEFVIKKCDYSSLLYKDQLYLKKLTEKGHSTYKSWRNPDFYIDKISTYDVNTMKEENLVFYRDTNKIWKYITDIGWTFFVSPDMNKILFYTGEVDGAVYVNCELYIYDKEKSTITQYPEQRLLIQNKISYNKFVVNWESGRLYDEKNGFIITDNYIFDKDLNLICIPINKSIETLGFISNNGNSSIILKSYFDKDYNSNKDKVWCYFEYPSNGFLDILISSVYHDKVISEVYLKKLNLSEINILKNGIFAKHNKYFKDKYLQAFFNIYDFYSEYLKDKNRLSDVTNLLTPTDKQNLQLIDARIKELEGK